MKICGYDIVSQNKTGCLAVKNGQLVFITRYAHGEMNPARAADITESIRNAVKPGTNVLIPSIEEENGVWFAAVPYCSEIFRGVPLKYLGCLPDEARRHMILLAVSAVETLARGRIVHGSLCPECFAFTVTNAGILCLTLKDIRNVGNEKYPPLQIDRESVYAAPEVQEGKAPTSASDVFSLGLCIHEWLSGELPRNINHDELMTRNNVLLSDKIPDWAVGAIALMLEKNGNARPSLTDILARLRKNESVAGLNMYEGAQWVSQEKHDIGLLLLREHEELMKRYHLS